MDRYNPKGERKKKVSEVITFPVPFAVEVIKKNININTNTASKSSKEKIIINNAFGSYIKAIENNPTNTNNYNLITRFLRDSDLSHLSKSNIKNIFNLLVERNDVPHKELVNVFNCLYREEIISTLQKNAPKKKKDSQKITRRRVCFYSFLCDVFFFA